MDILKNEALHNYVCFFPFTNFISGAMQVAHRIYEFLRHYAHMNLSF